MKNKITKLTIRIISFVLCFITLNVFASFENNRALANNPNCQFRIGQSVIINTAGCGTRCWRHTIDGHPAGCTNPGMGTPPNGSSGTISSVSYVHERRYCDYQI